MPPGELVGTLFLRGIRDKTLYVERLRGSPHLTMAKKRRVQIHQAVFGGGHGPGPVRLGEGTLVGTAVTVFVSHPRTVDSNPLFVRLLEDLRRSHVFSFGSIASASTQDRTYSPRSSPEFRVQTSSCPSTCTFPIARHGTTTNSTLVSCGKRSSKLRVCFLSA